jgi:GNAT superfamily N-acetyltransferase
MITVFEIDRDASVIAFDDGEPVGFANLALRGDQAWVGGVGVVTKARRQGIGEALLHALHAEELLRTLRGRGDVNVVNLPTDDPAAGALRTLGAAMRIRQREMILALQNRG